MNINIDTGLCAGFGQCYLMDSELFPLDDGGHSAVDPTQEVPVDKVDIAQAGIAACPMQALSLIDRG